MKRISALGNWTPFAAVIVLASLCQATPAFSNDPNLPDNLEKAMAATPTNYAGMCQMFVRDMGSGTSGATAYIAYQTGDKISNPQIGDLVYFNGPNLLTGENYTSGKYISGCPSEGCGHVGIISALGPDGKPSMMISSSSNVPHSIAEYNLRNSPLIGYGAGPQHAQMVALNGGTVAPAGLAALTGSFATDPYGNVWNGETWISPEGNVFDLASQTWWNSEGQVYDDVSGLWLSPQEYGLGAFGGYDPNTGNMWDPSANTWYDPATGNMYDMVSGDWVDPATGNVFDTETGIWTDPATGNVYDAATDTWSDPATGNTYDSATGVWSDPNGNVYDAATDSWSVANAVDGNVWDESIGAWTDPATGNVYDADTGVWSDPATGNTYDSETGVWTNPDGGTYDEASGTWSDAPADPGSEPI